MNIHDNITKRTIWLNRKESENVYDELVPSGLAWLSSKLDIIVNQPKTNITVEHLKIIGFEEKGIVNLIIEYSKYQFFIQDIGETTLSSCDFPHLLLPGIIKQSSITDCFGYECFGEPTGLVLLMTNVTGHNAEVQQWSVIQVVEEQEICRQIDYVWFVN